MIVISQQDQLVGEMIKMDNGDSTHLGDTVSNPNPNRSST